MNPGGTMSELLQVEDLHVWFPVKSGFTPWKRREMLQVRAVNGVSLHMRQGEVLGIVGESGCGKSTLARTVVRLEKPVSGRIVIEGEDIAHLGAAALRRLRPRIQMIFQDPYASLNPRMTVFDAIAEPIRVHRRLASKGLAGEVYALMDKVGLAARFVRKYPHEFSGGQRQRIAIARALALNPVLLLADEPVSALDVSVQAQIINLLAALQRDTGLAMMFISHDLGVVRHLAQRIAVMYLGRIVETGPAEAVFEAPSHPYTQALLAAIPIADPERERARIRPQAQGEPPSPLHPPSGCPFHPRCPLARAACAQQTPGLMACGAEHAVACPIVLEVPSHPYPERTALS